jgi:undecaprenyl-diphosphatase
MSRWGSWIPIGIALLLVAAFAELSEEWLERRPTNGPITGADAAILLAFARHRRPWLNGIAMDFTAVGSPVVVALFTFAFGAFLIAKSDRRGAFALVVASLASAPLTEVLKSILHRPRPTIVPRLVEVSSLSYPSGHALAAAAVYLTTAFVFARHVKRWGERASAIVFAAVVIAIIGCSRIYLGVHNPTDVFAGILVGTAWSLVMLVVLRRLDARPLGSASPLRASVGERAPRDGAAAESH